VSPQEFESLLGAYALDAVDDEERREIEAYLAVDPRARAEVEMHREVATLMAFSGAAAPDGLWDRIAGALDERAPAPGPELARVLPVPRRRRWSMVMLAAAGAAAATVTAAITVAVVHEPGPAPVASDGMARVFDRAMGRSGCHPDRAAQRRWRAAGRRRAGA
jgi:anti-sigma factor RsiW